VPACRAKAGRPVPIHLTVGGVPSTDTVILLRARVDVDQHMRAARSASILHDRGRRATAKSEERKRTMTLTAPDAAACPSNLSAAILLRWF